MKTIFIVYEPGEKSTLKNMSHENLFHKKGFCNISLDFIVNTEKTFFLSIFLNYFGGFKFKYFFFNFPNKNLIFIKQKISRLIFHSQSR